MSLLVNTNDFISIDGYSVSSVYSARNYDRLMAVMESIREDGNKELYQQLINDHVDIYHGKVPQDPDFAPRTVDISPNIVTHQGIALMIKNITGQDQNRGLYIISGEGNTEQPTIYSTEVEDENARMSILSTGFMFASGTALFQGALFPTTLPDAIVKSFGCATVADPSDPLHTLIWASRILDTSKYVYHYQNRTIYFHTHLLDFRPKLME